MLTDLSRVRIWSILGSNYIETKAPWQEVGLKFCEHFGAEADFASDCIDCSINFCGLRFSS